MGLFAWIILGGLAGWAASISAGTNAKMGLFANIMVGVLGSVVGGWVFSLFGSHGVTGLNLYSFVVALVGASVVLFVFKRIR